MAKFCTSCGSQVSDEANNCPNCGAPVGSPAPAAYTAPTAPVSPAPAVTYAAPQAPAGQTPPAKSGNTATYVGIGVVAVIAIIVIALIGNLFGGGGYKKPIDNMINGIVKQDADKFLAAFPAFMSKSMKGYIDDDYLEDMYDELVDDYGKNIKITYKVTDKEKLDKDDLEDYQDEIKSWYSKKVKITEGYELEVEMKIKGKDDSDENVDDIVVLKIDGEWCIYGGGLF